MAKLAQGDTQRLSRPSSALPQMRRPATATSRASSKPQVINKQKTPYPIAGDVGYYQRADVKGRIKKPKLDKDLAKLKDLFAYCEAANFREVRAMISHYPYLLSLTDAHGFSALHHAVMSGEPAFISKVLQLYRDPKTSLKNVVYSSEEELLSDMALGVQVVGRRSEDAAEARVVSIPVGSLAEEAGLMPGDRLEACSGTSFLSYRQPPPLNKNILESLRSKYVSTTFGFPVTLEFRGNAALEILCKDGWSPAHGAAGRGALGDRLILSQLLGEEELAQVSQDCTGCTPQHWAYIEQRMRQRSDRRPLSVGGRRKPKQKAKATKLVAAPSCCEAEEIVRSAPNLSAAPAPCVSHPMAMSRKPSVGDEVKEELPRSIGATAKDLAKLLGSSPRTSSSALKVPAPVQRAWG